MNKQALQSTRVVMKLHYQFGVSDRIQLVGDALTQSRQSGRIVDVQSATIPADQEAKAFWLSMHDNVIAHSHNHVIDPFGPSDQPISTLGAGSEMAMLRGYGNAIGPIANPDDLLVRPEDMAL